MEFDTFVRRHRDATQAVRDASTPEARKAASDRLESLKDAQRKQERSEKSKS